MKFTNLFLQVGRADPRCLGSVDCANPEHDTILASLKMQATSELLASGVAQERISFSSETVEQSTTPAKKGGRK